MMPGGVPPPVLLDEHGRELGSAGARARGVSLDRCFAQLYPQNPDPDATVRIYDVDGSSHLRNLSANDVWVVKVAYDHVRSLLCGMPYLPSSETALCFPGFLSGRSVL